MGSKHVRRPGKGLRGHGSFSDVEQNAFLLRLSDNLRPVADAVAVQEMASRLVGECLVVNRAGYAETEAFPDLVVSLARDWCSPGTASLAGRYRIADYGQFLLTEFSAGRPVIVDDTARDDRIAKGDVPKWRALDIAAAVVVPLVKEGRVAACMFVHTSRPRRWSTEEVGLLTEAAERTWSAVERARVEKALRESEQKYRTLFKTMGQGYTVAELIRAPDGHATDYTFIEVNPAYERLTGIPAEQVRGKKARTVFPNLEQAWIDRFDRVVRTKTPEFFEQRVAELDRWYQSFAYPESGDRFAVFSEDITQRKRAEALLRESHDVLEAGIEARTRELAAAREQAERSAALKAQFLAAAAHDLRQPLQATMSYIGGLRRLSGNQEAYELADRAKMQLQSMADILDALLDLSRLEGGAIEPRRCDFDVDKLIAKTVARFQPLAQSKGLLIRQHVASCKGYSDPALLERILANLVSNAIRYTDSGEVAVSCERRDDEIEIAVSDTGIGIPGEAIEAIFHPHVQLGNPARDLADGLGLGLSIVRSLSEALGHPIDVHSEEGKGSTFRVRIPASAIAGGSRPDERPAINILLIDDDSAVAHATAFVLKMEGWSVTIAGTCQDAMRTVDQGIRPDVILSDYRLSDGDGVDLVQRIRQSAKDEIPAIILTGDIRARQLDVSSVVNCQVLQKPIEADSLIEIVRSVAKTANRYGSRP